MVFVGLQKGVCILWYIFGLGNHMGFQTCYIKSLLPVCGYGFSWKLQRHYSGQKNGFHGYYKILQWNGWKAWWQGYLIYCQRTCSSTSNYYCWSISLKNYLWINVIEDEKHTTYITKNWSHRQIPWLVFNVCSMFVCVIYWLDDFNVKLLRTSKLTTYQTYFMYTFVKIIVRFLKTEL